MGEIDVARVPGKSSQVDHTQAVTGCERVLAAAKGRKIVVLITNCLDLNCIPFVDPVAHLSALRAFASAMAQAEDKVFLVIRLKPGVIGDEPGMYVQAGFRPDSISAADSCSLAAILRVADCAIGINTPTTAYYEALDAGVPLIHVQTTKISMPEPDLPEDVVNLVTREDEIWSAIEAVLFDPEWRADMIVRQKRFMAEDARPTQQDEVDIVKTIVDLSLQRASFKTDTAPTRTVGAFFPTMLDAIRKGIRRMRRSLS